MNELIVPLVELVLICLVEEAELIVVHIPLLDACWYMYHLAPRTNPVLQLCTIKSRKCSLANGAFLKSKFGNLNKDWSFKDFYKRVIQLIIIHPYGYIDEITIIEKVVSSTCIIVEWKYSNMVPLCISNAPYFYNNITLYMRYRMMVWCVVPGLLINTPRENCYNQ